MSTPQGPRPRPNRRRGGDDDGGLLVPKVRPPSERLTAPPKPGARRLRGFVLMLAALGLMAGGGYVYYRQAILPTIEPAHTPTVTPTVPEGPDGEVTLRPVGRDLVEGRAGSTIALGIRASISRGAPVADSVVYFEVLAGEGVLDPSEGLTDADGTVQTSITLPPRAGDVVVLARMEGADAQVLLTVRARSGPPQRIVAREGDGQRATVGELLPTRVSVIVYDAADVPVPGADVSFNVLSGEGITAPSRMRTDSLGVAAALWRLGSAAGTQQLSATAGAIGRSVTFTATGLALPDDNAEDLPAETAPVTVAPSNFVVGGSHVCALAGGSARCRGANDRGQRGSGTGGFVALASGISHICGLDATGLASCWGANQGGQLGDGSRTDRPSPVPVRTELRFSALTAGAAHTCGLAGSGVPICWGQNLSGQIGDGSRTDARFPIAVGGGLSFRTLVAGWSHTCGLTASGNAFCWGQNSNGQLGDGSRLDRLVPVLVRGSIESLTAGSAHTCGVSQDGVLCWGDNSFGQLGDGTNESRSQPVEVQGLPAQPRRLTAGAVHTCALMADGAAYCWGQNLQGQLGDGTTQNRNSASRVVGDISFATLEAGGAITCGISTDGNEYCWGLNQDGQLGDGSRQSRSSPTRVQS